MKFLRLRIGMAVVFLTSAALVALAQPPAPVQPPAKSPPPAGTTVPTTTYRAKQVLGAKVFIQGNIAIGTVEDLVFDDAGNLEYMIVANDGKLVTVPWQAAKFNFEKRTALVNLTAEQYKTIPTYTTTSYPEYYSPVYRADVFRFFGLRPLELRRLERRGAIP